MARAAEVRLGSALMAALTVSVIDELLPGFPGNNPRRPWELEEWWIKFGGEGAGDRERSSVIVG